MQRSRGRNGHGLVYGIIEAVPVSGCTRRQPPARLFMASGIADIKQSVPICFRHVRNEYLSGLVAAVAVSNLSDDIAIGMQAEVPVRSRCEGKIVQEIDIPSSSSVHRRGQDRLVYLGCRNISNIEI